MDKEPSTRFYGVLGHFSRTKKVSKSESLNCVSTLVTSSTRMNIPDILIVAPCKLLEFFVVILFYDKKGSF